MSERKIITVIEPEGPESWYASLGEKAEVRFFYPDGPITAAQARDLAVLSDGVIITSSSGFTAEDMDAAARLGIIAKCGGKPSNVDVPAATERGIAVTYVPGANSSTVAEYAVMTMLTSLRRYPLVTSAIRLGLKRTTTDLFGRELRGKKVGLIGYGAIGREVARRLEGFACTVSVYDPYYGGGDEPSCVTFTDDLDGLLAEADILSLHCTLSAETEGLIGERELALMKPGAGIVNCARGPLIDEAALEVALREGHLGVVVLDVFTVEPPEADHPLVDVEGATLTPHISSWTPEALHREVRGALDSVEAWLEGRPIPGLINSDYVHKARWRPSAD
jgi:phosphoglycerate dehydrogenase-like enzyme